MVIAATEMRNALSRKANRVEARGVNRRVSCRAMDPGLALRPVVLYRHMS
jgi:hypothetical protein